MRPPIRPTPTRNAGIDAVEPVAANALAAIIDAGAQALIAEPWRASRIIRDAEYLTIDELDARMARRRRAAPADINQAIALAQLSRALKSPLFRRRWTSWRAGAAIERSQHPTPRCRIHTSETDVAHGDSASLIA